MITIARAFRGAVLASAASLLFGCAVVKINHDGTNSVEHSGGDDVGLELANRTCHKARAVRAEIVSTVKKNDKKADSEKPDEGRSVTTFRCIY